MKSPISLPILILLCLFLYKSAPHRGFYPVVAQGANTSTAVTGLSIQQYHPKVWGALGADLFRDKGYMVSKTQTDSGQVHYTVVGQDLIQQQALRPQYSWWEDYGIWVLVAVCLLILWTKSWVYEKVKGYPLNRIYERLTLGLVLSIAAYDLFLRESWVLLRFSLFFILCATLPLMMVWRLRKMEEKALALFLLSYKKMPLPRRLNPTISYTRVWVLLGVWILLLGLTALLSRDQNLYLAVGANQLMIFLALKYHS